MRKILKPSGFTLIELLVVIAIISLLSSIIIASLGQTRAKSRDSKRIQDLKQLETALELFYSDFGHYPKPKNPAPYSAYFNYGLGCWDCDPSSSAGFSGFAFDAHKIGGISLTEDPSGNFVYDGLDTNSLGKVYLRIRPQDPKVPSGGFFTNPIQACGYWYVFDDSPDGPQNYKVVNVGTWEGDPSSMPPNMADTYFSPAGCPGANTKSISVHTAAAGCWGWQASRPSC